MTPGYIKNNETRYSTDDLNKLLYTFLETARLVTPEGVAGRAFQDYSWSRTASIDPVNLATWSDWNEADFVTARRLNQDERGSSYSSLFSKGPWFIRAQGGKKRRKYRDDKELETIYVLSPRQLSSLLSPLEALASVGSSLLYVGAIAQVLSSILPYAGLKLMNQNQRLANYNMCDNKALLELVEVYMQKSELKVRILDSVVNPKPSRRSSKEDSVARLIQIYTKGSVARTLGHKTWTLSAISEQVFRAWDENQTQLQRVLKAGGDIRPAEKPSEMLRRLAAELELRENARKETP